MFTHLKALFKKDAAKITVPVEAVFAKLTAYITKIEAEVKDNIKTVEGLLTKNEALKLEAEAAAKIKAAIAAILPAKPVVATPVEAAALVPAPVVSVVAAEGAPTPVVKG